MPLSIDLINNELIYKMPAQIREKSISFLTPELYWSSSLKDIEKLYGKHIEKVTDYELKYEKTYTYQIQYNGHNIDVSATKKMFPYNTNIYEYCYITHCVDNADLENVFNNYYEQIIDYNKNDEYFKFEDDDVDTKNKNFSIDYGSTGIYYELFCIQSEVYLIVTCQY